MMRIGMTLVVSYYDRSVLRSSLKPPQTHLLRLMYAEAVLVVTMDATRCTSMQSQPWTAGEAYACEQAQGMRL